MSKIHYLSPYVYQKIAAGESIENLTSIINELIDNSIDAQSNLISIFIDTSNHPFIHIQDNGIGMSKEDMMICFHRYTTSKINHFEDIYKISSLGFRGEALHSISSVSTIYIQSRTKDNLTGNAIFIKFNEILSKKEITINPGTMITVKNIFDNMPVRRMNLRFDSFELNNIKLSLIKKTLPFLSIHFQFFHNNKLLLDLYKTDSILKRIYSIQQNLSPQKNFIFIKHKEHEFKISSYISKPNFYKNKREIYFYINNRYFYNLSFQKIVLECYQHILPIGKYPIAYFFIELPSYLIDINIHPTKREVHIFVEKEIKKVIQNIIQKNLIKNPYIPSLKNSFTTKKNILTPIQKLKTIRISKNTPQNPTENLFSSTSFTNLYSEKASGFPSLLLKLSKNLNPSYTILTQIFKTYILIEFQDEIILIDQHATHEILNYLKIKKIFLNKNIETQYLIHPITLKINSEDQKLFSQNDIQEKVKNLGIEYSILNKSLNIHTLPFFMDKDLVKKSIFSISYFIRKNKKLHLLLNF